MAPSADRITAAKIAFLLSIRVLAAAFIFCFLKSQSGPGDKQGKPALN
jgi:hypothetical protein